MILIPRQLKQSLAWLIRNAAEEIQHPTDESRSLWTMKDGGDWSTYNAETKGLQAPIEYDDLFASGSGISPLGSGSDYTGFLAYLGISSTDLGYGGGPKDAPYHYHS